MSRRSWELLTVLSLLVPAVALTLTPVGAPRHWGQLRMGAPLAAVEVPSDGDGEPDSIEPPPLAAAEGPTDGDGEQDSIELSPPNQRLRDLKEEESRLMLQLRKLGVEKDALLKARPLSIGIIGFGKFGQFLAKRFKSQGHEVSALSRSDYASEAASLGVKYFGGLGGPADCDEASSFFKQPKLDAVVLAVSILSFERTVESLPLHLLEARGGVLLVDVLSVKLHPRAVLERRAPANCDVLCTHPMFGPESGSSSWHQLPFVFEKVRVCNTDRVEHFLSIFESEGCDMVEMDADRHDANAANSQFATHLVGRLLEQLELTPTPIDTRAFQQMLALKQTVAGDSFDLFYGLFKYNPNSIETLLLLRKALLDVEWRLQEMDVEDPGTPGWKGTTRGKQSARTLKR